LGTEKESEIKEKLPDKKKTKEEEGLRWKRRSEVSRGNKRQLIRDEAQRIS